MPQPSHPHLYGDVLLAVGGPRIIREPETSPAVAQAGDQARQSACGRAGRARKHVCQAPGALEAAEAELAALEEA